MKILWICGSAVLGGAERATLRVSGLLQARGHSVTVLCRRDGPVAEAARRADHLVLGASFGEGLNPRGYFAIHRALMAVAPDVALVTTVHEWLWSCALVRRPASLVLARFMVLPLPAPLLWMAGQRADGIVAVSQAVKRSLVHRGRLPAGLIHVIPGPARFPPRSNLPTADDRASARTALGLGGSGHWVGFFGGLNTAKGVVDALRIVAEANRRLTPTHLVVCGREAAPGDLERVRSSARALGLEGRLHYLGEVERVDDVMTAVDVVVMATQSRLGEALPLTLLEAMSCGTPVAAYAVGGVPEVIGEDEGAGRLAPPDDAAALARVVIDLLADPAEATRRATNALARVRERFDPEQAASRYDELFLRLRFPLTNALQSG